MNVKNEVTWGTLRTIAQYIMVHAWVLDEYIHFVLMYTTHNIFLVLSINHLLNRYGEPTTAYKLETGTKPSVSNLHVIFYHILYKNKLHTLTESC